MKKQLYLMRHGETLFNQLGKIQGACDSPLTNKGKKQAKQAATFFQENQIHFDHYYSSTQERACDTLEIITNSNHDYGAGRSSKGFGNIAQWCVFLLFKLYLEAF